MSAFLIETCLVRFLMSFVDFHHRQSHCDIQRSCPIAPKVAAGQAGCTLTAVTLYSGQLVTSSVQPEVSSLTAASGRSNARNTCPGNTSSVRCTPTRPVLPRILSCDNACQDHGLADRCDRNRGRVRRSASQLVGQVRASVRHRAVQHCRRGVAEANAANCLQRDGLSSRREPAETPSACSTCLMCLPPSAAKHAVPSQTRTCRLR
jgi:hypothetical protein